MSHVFLIVFCFVIKWSSINGSNVELNQTILNSIPPLYTLDDSSRCQGPGDVYCMVDAVLISLHPSPILDLLKEYSTDTLKHYNRTVIHRGICVSQCVENGLGNRTHAAELCVNEGLRKYALQAEVLSVGYCKVYSSDARPTSGPARALAVFCTTLVAMAILATGLHILRDKCIKSDGNKYLAAFSIKKNWSVLTYNRSKSRSNDRMKDVACIEAIRFIGIQGVIFGHVVFIYVYSYIDNPENIEQMYGDFIWQAVFNTPLWIQAFFSISGFLTAYSVLIISEQKAITIYNCIMSVINRWVRLTPLAVFALWFTIAWFPLLGSGPQWGWLVEREAHDCAQTWLYHVIYVHNHLPPGKFCMNHTWYLAVDMQLHILGMVLLYLVTRYRSYTTSVLAAILISSSVAAGTVVYLYQLMPIVTAQAPEVIRTLFSGSIILTHLYTPVWMNLSGYVCGVAVAFAFYHHQVDGFKIHNHKWFNVSFHGSLLTGGFVVCLGTVFFAPHAQRWAAILYSALDRTLVAMCFSVFMLGCFVKSKSSLHMVLEWRGFQFLGRLSYCVFLIHFIVLRLTFAGNTNLHHASWLAFVSLYLTTSALSYLASIPLCLLVELPAIQLWKALTDYQAVSTIARPARPTRPPIRPEEPPPTVKPFDLVSQLRNVTDYI